VFSDPNVPNGLNRSIDFRAVTLEHDQQLTNYRQEWAERFERDSNHAGSCHLPLRYLSSAFPDIALIFPVTVQMRPACSVSSSCLCTLQSLLRCLSFLIRRLVLRFFRVVATPIMRDWSCSRSDSKRHSSGVSNPMMKFSSQG
jgi:hypothetical protein